MPNVFESTIVNVCVSKHREEDIAKESRNVLNGIWSITNECVYVSLWLYVFTCVCVSLSYFSFVPRPW